MMFDGRFDCLWGKGKTKLDESWAPEETTLSYHSLLSDSFYPWEDRIFGFFGWLGLCFAVLILSISKTIKGSIGLGFNLAMMILLNIVVFLVLGHLSRSLYKAFKVWQSSLASRYEQQCQQILRAYNLQIVHLDRKRGGYQLGFVRRMSRRLVVFVEAFRDEFAARKELAMSHSTLNKKKL